MLIRARLRSHVKANRNVDKGNSEAFKFNIAGFLLVLIGKLFCTRLYMFGSLTGS